MNKLWLIEVLTGDKSLICFQHPLILVASKSKSHIRHAGNCTTTHYCKCHSYTIAEGIDTIQSFSTAFDLGFGMYPWFCTSKCKSHINDKGNCTIPSIISSLIVLLWDCDGSAQDAGRYYAVCGGSWLESIIGIFISLEY